MAHLCGQQIYTIEMFRPVRNYYRLQGTTSAAAMSRRGLSWMSTNVYRYPHLMLMNLAPRGPAVQRWPCYQWPPPHFLVGYQYLVRVCNDYVFDERAFSRVGYLEIRHPQYRAMDWSCLANCSYTIDVGAYLRFLDVDDFENTLMSMQQAVLADRVVADLQLINPMRGVGRWNLPGDPPPTQQQQQQQQNNNNDDVETPSLRQLLGDRYRHLASCGPDVWGLSRRASRVITPLRASDTATLAAIRDLRSAYFRYLITDLQAVKNAARGGSQNQQQQQRKLSLPLDASWLTPFVRFFARDPTVAVGQDDSSRATTSTTAGEQVGDLSTTEILSCVLDALALPHDLPAGGAAALPMLQGGALELRPREDGRAVTAVMRRQRGEVVADFIESLPIPSRRRRRPAQPMPVSDSEDEDEDDQEPEPRHDDFRREVRAAVAEAIAALQEELTDQARDDRFFNFPQAFYTAMQRLEELDDLNETTLRRWVMYFFICEHIATTLNYLHARLRRDPLFARHCQLLVGQVVMRARAPNGELCFSRVWNEHGNDALQRVIERIVRDLAATVERAGLAEIDEDQLEAFMDDIAFHDNSGDVDEIVRQVTLNDADIDSVELSFRVKVRGPVALAGNQNIRDVNTRVLIECARLRNLEQPLPQLHDPVVLPPMPPELAERRRQLQQPMEQRRGRRRRQAGEAPPPIRRRR